MADTAPRDPNFVPAILGVSSSDLLTPTKIAVDPTSNRLLVNAIGSTLTQITNQTVNLVQINGVATSVNKGVSDAGTLRVSLGDGSQTIGSVTVLGTISTTPTVDQTVHILAGSALIGSVSISGAIPAGTNAIGTVAVSSIQGALPSGSNLIGSVQINGTPTVINGTGSNLIGTVQVSSIPSIPTGSNLIGSVQISGTPSVINAAGSNLIGSISVSGALPNGNNNIGTVGIIGAIPSGSNQIGTVQIGGSLPVGSNRIGTVTIVGERSSRVQTYVVLNSTTGTTTVIAAVSNIFNDVYGVVVSNMAAAANKVAFRDSTDGNTVFVIEVPATDVRGFMLPADSGIPQTNSNSIWQAQCGTSGSIEITMLYQKRNS